MTYVLRVKGETKGWIFAEGFVCDSELHYGRNLIDMGKKVVDPEKNKV